MQQRFIRRGSTPRSNPQHFPIPYLTEKVAISCIFYWQIVPLSYTECRPLHPFSMP